MAAWIWEAQSRYLDQYLAFYETTKDIGQLKRQLHTLKYKKEFIDGLIADKEREHEQQPEHDNEHKLQQHKLQQQAANK
jgi:hypothetical protein